MAVYQEETLKVSGGFSKEINKDAQQMVFDLLQKHQYSFPIKSTIREVVSNGLDSIREKNVAKSILLGLSKVEDHFVDMEGEIYADSKFDSSYYDLAYLSEQDMVEILYLNGGETGKDSVIIRDYGVGLGGKRLQGYFNLGYSSKRLNRFALGKFGLGAKSPLSTGAPFYTMVTRWNGKEFSFNVYSHKVESIVPKFDMNTGKQNPVYQFDNGYECHYRVTEEPNMVEILMQVKKHHKEQYIEAVTSQMLYFNNVRLYDVSPNNLKTEMPVQAKIMFENDLIVLSDNSPYSKPHMLLNGVNYGYLDFREMELEDMNGNIGIKVDPEQVSVNPSRESLIWDDKTREVVVQKFNDVVALASQIINEQLKETDFLKWLRVCAVANRSGGNGKWWYNSDTNNTVIGRLANVVDMNKIELSYPADPRFKFNGYLMDGVRISRVEMITSREGSTVRKKVEYQSSWNGALIEGLPLIVSHEKLSNRKNKYLLSKVYPQGFVLIQLAVRPEDGRRVVAEDITNQAMIEAAARGKNEDRFQVARQRIADLHNFILSSADIMWYEQIEVPADFKAREDSDTEEEEEEETVVEEQDSRTLAEKRKELGLTVLHTPRFINNYNRMHKLAKFYEMQKVEMPMHLVNTWSNAEVYWANNDAEPLLHLAALLTCDATADADCWKNQHKNHSDHKEWIGKGYRNVLSYDFPNIEHFHDDSPVRLIKVAQDNVKYYRDFKHITKFFKTIKNKTITMSNALVRWNTARLIKQRIDELRFLNGFAPISDELKGKYDYICNYMSHNWREIQIKPQVLGTDDTTTSQLIKHMDKVAEFQLFVRDNPDDKESIVALAQELFNPAAGIEIEDGRAIDIELYDMFMKLVDWAAPIQVMLNMVYPLIRAESITQEQEQQIRQYMKYRNCDL